MMLQKLETLREQLARELMVSYLAEMDALIGEAGYEMEIPDEATVEDYLAQVEALVGDPAEEIVEDARAVMKEICDKLAKVVRAAPSAAQERHHAFTQARAA